MIATASHAAVTLVRDAIHRPDEPRHFMVLRRLRGTATARLGDAVLARSDRALVVREVGSDVYEPVVYFPPGDVRGQRLTPIEKTTRCPLKGTATWYDVDADGTSAPAAAWSYRDVHLYDVRIGQLEGCVGFDRAQVTIEVDPR